MMIVQVQSRCIGAELLAGSRGAHSDLRGRMTVALKISNSVLQ